MSTSHLRIYQLKRNETLEEHGAMIEVIQICYSAILIIGQIM